MKYSRNIWRRWILAMGSRKWLLLILLLLWGLPALADTPCKDLEKKLHLSADQRTRLREIHRRYAEQKTSLSASLQQKRDLLASQMSASTPDRTAIAATLQEIVNLEGQRQKVMVDEYCDVLTVLRPDQKRVFQEQVVKRIVADRP